MAHARVSTYEIPADRLDEARPAFEEATRNLQEMSGAKEALFLIDRTEGRAMTITIWESQSALLASEDSADEIRKRGAAAGGGDVKTVDRYEVVLHETF